MARMNEEDYAPEAVKEVAIDVLEGELETLLEDLDDAATRGENFEKEGNMRDAFVAAADIGVANIKVSIIRSEIVARKLANNEEVSLEDMLGAMGL